MTAEHAELRALAEAATPGPWDVRGRDHQVCVAEHGGQVADTFGSLADAAFIAAANPTAVLALLDAIARVEALHRPSTDHGEEYDPYCVGCWEAGGQDGAPSWPCPTMRALDPPS